MGAIKRLPEALRNTVRSGVVLFDLTRVVEELVFNSLDAGAKKVLVYVGVGTCYVKVVDDGSGISRDGLVLLGERYATSKLQHLADMDAITGTFGFRGEALASIADVSLLEVITKAYGRPNGYRKVMKGSKCLFLGINDDRKDVGTTVVVRDLFYNQPVRRKCMQSSPKKDLHSVKKSVLRIALVHSKVSFKVVDIESEVELLSTHSSSSPLSLLINGFGIEDSSFLHELNADDDVFKISGYISSPCNTFADKAFQYVYINSRYICKGPIHKLMNHLAAGFECLDSWKVNSGSRKGKRHRSQAYPAYILNLICPQSLYELTFEPSKTYVVFKDWGPVFTFIQKAIQAVWMKDTTYGESFNHTADLVGKDEIRKKGGDIISVGDIFDADFSEKADFREKADFSQFRFQNHQASLHLPPSPSNEIARKDNNLFLGKCERNTFHEFEKDTKKLKEENTEMEFYCQTDYALPLNGSIADCSPRVPWKIDNHLWTSDNNLLLRDSYLSDAGRSICVEGDFSSSQSGKEYFEVECGTRSEPSGSAIFDASNELELRKDIKQPFMQSCSSRGCLPLDETLFSCEEGFESPTDSFKKKPKQSYIDERLTNLKVDVNYQSFDFFPRTLWQEEASYIHHSPRFMTKGDRSTGFDLQPRAFSESSSYAEPFTEKTSFLSDSDAIVGTDPQSLHSEWCSVTSDPLFQVASRGVGHYTNENALEGSFRFGEEPNFRQLVDGEENSKYSYDITLKSTNQDKCTSSCSDTGLDFEYNDFSKDFYKIHWEDNHSKKVAPKHFDNLINEIDWLCAVSCGNNNADISKFGSRRGPVKFQNFEKVPIPKERLRRSHSAPPFVRQKTRFISLNCCSAIPAGKPNVHTFQNELTFPEAGARKHLQQTSDICHLNFKPSPMEDLLFGTRLDATKSSTTVDMKKTHEVKTIKHSQCAQAHHGAQDEDFISKEIQDSVESLTKWRSSCPQNTKNNRSCDIHYQDNILDISSGLLQLAGDSLIPQSINKSCLEDAKVLQQVDKKFIAVVAGGTLAVIDQHAADERIRLEELRQKVLSGEAKTITYLDAEQELVLPEIGYQLVHSYAEQIKDWGWICNIHNQSSKSFKKNLDLLNRQPTVFTLLAVPCILGVNLSDVDLLEFLQQLAETDGSSTMPPSVLRVLNSKACRGAIMFGDSLLPSECSLIVEELKQTSLCFQCAHGRPTTVPLVNLEALHKRIAHLRVLNNQTVEVWHGFQRHEPNLERARARLRAAKG